MAHDKFITFTTYDNDDIQVLHISDFTSNENFNDWVWHIAPSQEAALARHIEAHDMWSDNPDKQDYFDHANPPPGWNHAMDLNFDVISRLQDGSDVTGAQIREAILNRLARTTDEELRVECQIHDTMRDGDL